MSVPFTTDLLSAYLDGELSPAEVEIVERQLAERPDLREELGELRQTSQRVQGLARPTAPFDFADGVLEILKQRTVVGDNPPGPADGSSPWSWARWQRRLLLMATCLTAATGVWLFQSVNDSNVEVSGNGVVNSDTLARHDGILTLESASTQPEMLAMGSAQSDLAARLLPHGRQPSAGELLSYLELQDGEPAIVEYTVADVQEAFGQVQLLLSQNGIRQLSTGDFQPSEDGQLVAIYIEADDKQIATVVDEMQLLPNCVSLACTNSSDVDIPYLTGAVAKQSRIGVADRVGGTVLSTENLVGQDSPAEPAPPAMVRAANAPAAPARGVAQQAVSLPDNALSSNSIVASPVVNFFQCPVQDAKQLRESLQRRQLSRLNEGNTAVDPEPGNSRTPSPGEETPNPPVEERALRRVILFVENDETE